MSGSYLSGIFGKSPVRPLQEHMQKVVACVAELKPFINAVIKDDEQGRLEHHQNIVTMENEADNLKKRTSVCDYPAACLCR